MSSIYPTQKGQKTNALLNFDQKIELQVFNIGENDEKEIMKYKVKILSVTSWIVLQKLKINVHFQSMFIWSQNIESFEF